MTKRAVPYEEGLDRDLQNREFAAAYLTESFNDSEEAFLVALRDVVRARGGFKAVAAQAERGREALYRALSENGNPSIAVLMDVFSALELKVQFAA